MDAPANLNPDTISSLTTRDLESWVVRRLHGADRLAPLDSTDDDYWHLLFHDIYFSPAFDGDFRRAFRTVLANLLSEVLTYPNSDRWTDPAAVAELLMLAPDLINDGTQLELQHAAALLLNSHHLLPWRATSKQRQVVRLRLRGLTALVELRWDRIPSEKHPTSQYWSELWHAGTGDESDPIYQYSGEQAGLMLEALLKTRNLISPSNPRRYQRLEQTFQWLGAARPWRERYLLSALKALLKRRLLPMLDSSHVLSLIKNETLPRLQTKEQGSKVLEVFSSIVYQSNELMSLPKWLAPSVEASCPSAIVIEETSTSITITSDSQDAQFLALIGEAARETDTAPSIHKNTPEYVKLDSVANYIRDRRSDILRSSHPLHSRFDSYQQFAFDLLSTRRNMSKPH